MTFITLDTTQFSNIVQKAEIQRQASAELSEAIKDAKNNSTKDLVTKCDLRYEIDIMKKDIMIKLGGLVIAGIVILALLIKL